VVVLVNTIILLIDGVYSKHYSFACNSRYEIFMDEVKPSDLSLSFLREFMDLPVSYFQPGAQIKYRKREFILFSL